MKIGELFAGYGGLGMGVKAALGGEVAWVSDIDPGANKILEHRFPGVPNIGDITKVDWSQVEPVDVLTGGFPCQDVSAAGKRAGIRPGTRSGLWSQFAYAIDQLRPELVVIENVRGLLSAKAHSDVEPCAWCLGDDTDGALRALGAVLGDLASLGYDASWHGLLASEVGAPHGRFRVFVVAYPQHAQLEGVGQLSRLRGRPNSRPALRMPLGASGDVSLLPTPAVNDMGEGETVGNEHGKSLAIEAQRLLPTPTSSDAKASGAAGYNGNEFCTLTDATVRGKGYMHRPNDTNQWGDYAPAIARWETVLDRPAPAPTETGPKGSPRLSPRFVEFLMGLPAGWVTDVPGLTRNAQLKALGNGVVPQQAEAALRIMLAEERAA